MRKFYLLMLTLAATGSFAQIVNIPDANFKTALLLANTNNGIALNAAGNQIKIDTNNDGQIQVSEALLVRRLWIQNYNIASLTGLNSFTNLTGLDCSDNNIASLDLTALANLVRVDCFSNPLTTLNVAGLQNLEFLDCSMSNISTLNLTGLPNLDFLWASQCNLTAIDVSNLPMLETLYIDSNQISAIDLSNNPLLKEFTARWNTLASLTVADKPFLEKVHVSSNQLNSLTLTNLPVLTDVDAALNNLPGITYSNIPSLEYLLIQFNQFATFNPADFPALISIDCRNNQLSELDFSSNPALKTVWCSYNQLTSLDFSANPQFITLYCRNNNLQSINVKNGTDLGYLYSGQTLMNWSNNPLQFVCIDESETAALETILSQSSLSGVNYNTYCSFTPGGAYHTIAGTVNVDDDANGCDAADAVSGFVRLRMVDGTNTSYAFTDNNGQYHFYANQGTFVVYPDLENPAYFAVTPPVSLYNFATDGSTTNPQDYCILPNGVHPDLEVAIVPVGPARAGFYARYSLVVKNNGNQTLSGNVDLNFNDSLMDLLWANTLPDSQSIGMLTWNYTIRPLETKEYKFQMDINAPTDSPPVNIDDVLAFSATASPVAGDDTPADNVFNLNQVVVGAYDPNDKHCIEGDVVSTEHIGQFLHYVINFENEGNFEAENVVIKDMVDTDKFDLASMQVLAASHQMRVEVAQNKVEFIFENIGLQPEEPGYVSFKIKTKPDLVIGSTVTNKADIYFDFNFPVETNTASTTFQALGLSDVTDLSVRVYPNPGTDLVNIGSQYAIEKITCFDMRGRQVVASGGGNLTTIDVSKWTRGIYVLKIETARGIKIERFVKE